MKAIKHVLKTILITISCICAVSLLSACSNDKAKERSKHIISSKEPVAIAITWPKRGRLENLYRGATLAAEQVNTKGGVLKRKLKLLEHPGKESVTKSLLDAKEITKNKNVLAVIGHYHPYLSIPTSTLFQFHGIIMIDPATSNKALTNRGYDLVFRLIPNNDKFGFAAARYAKAKGYKKIIIYYVKNDFGRELANAFEKNAFAEGLDIVDRLSYEDGQRDFSNTLEDWKLLHKFDAVFVAGDPTETALIIQQARKLKLMTPFIGSHRLDSDEFIKLAGKEAEGTVFISTYHPDEPNQQTKDFVKGYKARFGKMPDTWAALGYDAVNLLVKAIEASKSIDAKKIANTLKKLKNIPGVAGPYQFNQQGDLVKPKLILKVIKDGKSQRVLSKRIKK